MFLKDLVSYIKHELLVKAEIFSIRKYNVFLIIFIICFFYSLLALSVGWNNPLLDQHSFRQTQTAISVYYMLQGSSWIAYETPVLGAPWSIPFEFPLYQWLVAILVKLFSTPLDQTGRFVSVIFFYLSLIPSYIILNCLNIPRQYRWIFLSLFLTSPLYIFWSRTFMIESTVLFFSLAYLASVCLFFRKKNLIFVLLSIIFGVLAALVKVTTFAGFLLAAGFFTLHNWQKTQKNYSHIFLNLIVPAIAFALIPYIAISNWTHFADSQKILNPIASDFITSKALTTWNFGILQQRFSIDFLLLLARTLLISSPAILILIPSLFFGTYRKLALASLILYVFPMLVFTNLHIVHNYYQCANGIFLIASVSFCLLSLIEREGLRKWIRLRALVFILIFQILQTTISWVSTNNVTDNPLIETAAVIQKYTDPSDILLVYGLDWSSELPYYSQRRALMDKRTGMSFPDEPKMNKALNKLSNYRIGAMVFCNKKTEETFNLTEVYHFQREPMFNNSKCQIHLPLMKLQQ